MNRILKPILLLAALATPISAWAHAMLLKSEPAVGSSVSPAPQNLTMHFSEGVEPLFTTVAVTDANGVRVDTGKVATAPDDNKTLLVPLRALPPGAYNVEWHATSVDTHKTNGKFVFNVSP
jgi:copper resistance protein C